MKTRYYVDVENIGNLWVTICKQVSDHSVVNLITSQNTRPTFENLAICLARKIKLNIYNTFAIKKGDQSCDHFLIGLISTKMIKNPDDEYVIVSNDKGYDVFIENKKMMYNIRRERAVTRFDMKIDNAPIYEGLAKVDDDKNTGSIDLEKTTEELKKICDSNELLKENVKEFLKKCIEMSDKKGKKKLLQKYNFDELANTYINTNGDFTKMLDTIQNKTSKIRLSSSVPHSLRSILKDSYTNKLEKFPMP